MTVTLTREMYREGIYQGKLIGNIHISGTYKGGLCELSPHPPIKVKGIQFPTPSSPGLSNKCQHIQPLKGCSYYKNDYFLGKVLVKLRLNQTASLVGEE